jgi:hypothetical protein
VNDPGSTAPYWQPGDAFTQNVQIQQSVGADDCTSVTSCADTLWLGMTLYDHNSNLVVDPTQPGNFRPVHQEGVTTYSLPTGFTITSTNLGGGTSASLQCEIGTQDSFVTACGLFKGLSDTLTLTYKVDGTIGGTGSIGGSDFTNQECVTLEDKTASVSGSCQFGVGTNLMTVNVQNTKDGGSTFFTGPLTVELKPQGSATATSGGTDLCNGNPQVTWTGNVALYKGQQGGSGYTISPELYEGPGVNQQGFTIKITCDSAASAAGSTATPQERYDAIVENAWENAEPGQMFIDKHWNYSPDGVYPQYKGITTNPSLRWNTLVQTDLGLFTIQELADKQGMTIVKNVKNEWQVGKVFMSGKDKELYKITFTNGYEVYCTPEHKWPILNTQKRLFNGQK